MSQYKVYEDKNKISFNWWGISSFCFCSLLIIVIFLIVRTLTDKQRFTAASEALKVGDSQMALKALT